MPWECPRCRTIHSDWKASCDCPAPTGTVSNYSTADLDMIDKHGLHIRATCSPECDGKPDVDNDQDCCDSECGCTCNEKHTDIKKYLKQMKKDLDKLHNEKADDLRNDPSLSWEEASKEINEFIDKKVSTLEDILIDEKSKDNQ